MEDLLADFPKACKAPMENQVMEICPSFFLTVISFGEHKPSWGKIFKVTVSVTNTIPQIH